MPVNEQNQFDEHTASHYLDAQVVMNSFSSQVLDKNTILSHPYGRILFVVCMVANLSFPSAFAKQAKLYQYPDKLPQQTVKFFQDSPPKTRENHQNWLILKPAYGQSFPEGHPPSLQLHYCRKDGSDAATEPYNLDFQKKNSREIEIYDCRWKVESVTWATKEAYAQWTNAVAELGWRTNGCIILDNQQLDEITRCYILWNQGNSTWVSQEFGIHCGGQGRLHAQCTSCFMPVALENLDKHNLAPKPSADELVGQDLCLASDIPIYSLDVFPREALMGQLKALLTVHVVRRLSSDMLHVKFTTSKGQTIEGAAKYTDLLLSRPAIPAVQVPQEIVPVEQGTTADARNAKSLPGAANQGRVSLPLSRDGGNLVVKSDKTTFSCHMDSWWGDGSLAVYQGASNKMLGYKKDCHSLPPDTRDLDMGWDFTSDSQTIYPGSVFVLVNNENHIAAIKILSIKILGNGDGDSQIEVEVEYKIY